MIKVREIEKSYGREKVLTSLSLTIPTGSVYGLIGPNGIGKTTLLNIIAGVYKADSGQVLFDDSLVYENLITKKDMVYIPDSLYFFGAKTIHDLSTFYKNMYGRFDTTLYTQLLKVFELDEKKPIQKFSKGMKKQAIFIVCMSVKPEILLMDELIDGIDPLKRRLLWSVLMNEVAKGNLTVVIVSHNIKELESVCSDIGIIENGVCVLEENVEILREKNNMSLEDLVVSRMGGVSDEVKEYLYQ